MANFVEGALRNALSIQTNPSALMSGSQRAMGASGNLALKLTALIDQEEAQRQNHMVNLGNQVLKSEQLLETKRSNMIDEKLRSSRLELDATKFIDQVDQRNKVEEAALAGATQPLLKTTKVENIGTEDEIKSTELVLVNNEAKYASYLKMASETKNKLEKSLQLETQNINKMITPEARIESEKKIDNLNLSLKSLDSNVLTKTEEYKAEQRGIEESIKTLGTKTTKNLTLGEFKDSAEKEINRINNDKTLTTLSKVAKINKIRADVDTKIALEAKEVADTKDEAKEVRKDKRKLTNDITLETVKNEQKIAAKLEEIKASAKYKAMTKVKQAAFEAYLDEKMSGPIDFFIRNPATILKNFEKEYSEE